MSKQVKKLFQGLLSGIASAGYKVVGGWIVQGSIFVWLAVISYVDYMQNTK